MGWKLYVVVCMHNFSNLICSKNGDNFVQGEYL